MLPAKEEDHLLTYVIMQLAHEWVKFLLAFHFELKE